MGPTPRNSMWTPANIVTVVRILLIPVFVAVLLSPWPEWFPDPGFWGAAQPWVAAIVFAGISATDALDGYLARSRGEVTTLGKFMDPLADKILVCAALLALVELGDIPSWIALVIITREFIVSGLRMLAAAEGVVIAASWYGKVKTVLQICAILLFIVKDAFDFGIADGGAATGTTAIAWLVMAAAVFMTLLSMVDYLKKSRSLFTGVSSKEDGAAVAETGAGVDAGEDAGTDAAAGAADAGAAGEDARDDAADEGAREDAADEGARASAADAGGELR